MIDELVEYRDLTVGVFNIERFGYDIGRSHHRLKPALDFMLSQTPELPDVLALPEATHGLTDRQGAIRRTAHYLSSHLESGHYEPLFAHQSPQGRRNHLHLVLVNTKCVHPYGWSDPEAPDGGKRHYGIAECEIYGHETKIGCEHWPGGEGRSVFDAAANRIGGHGGPKNKSLFLGDFNADSGWRRELHKVNKLNWYHQCRDQGELGKILQKGWFNPEGVNPHTGEPGYYYPWNESGERGWWEIDTRQIDLMRTWFQYRDMGEEFDDPTPTTKPAIGSGLRIDRIFRSEGFPGEVTAYGVAQPPRELSDHAYVFGTYRMPVAVIPDPL